MKSKKHPTKQQTKQSLQEVPNGIKYSWVHVKFALPENNKFRVYSALFYFFRIILIDLHTSNKSGDCKGIQDILGKEIHSQFYRTVIFITLIEITMHVYVCRTLVSRD